MENEEVLKALANPNMVAALSAFTSLDGKIQKIVIELIDISTDSMAHIDDRNSAYAGVVAILGVDFSEKKGRKCSQKSK